MLAALLGIFSGPVSAWSLADFLIAILMIAGAIAITFIILRVMQVQIPPWVIQIFWIVVAVCVGIFAIRFILSM